MKPRVHHAKRRYKDKVYSTPLLVYSYRDEQGTPRNKTLLNLSSLPPHAIDALDRALRSSEAPTVSVESIEYQFSVPFGHAAAVRHLTEELGIREGLGVLTPAQQDMALAMITNRCASESPWSIRALADSWGRSAFRFLTGRNQAPRKDYWYGTLDALTEKQEEIETSLYHRHMDGRDQSNGTVFLYDVTSTYLEGTHCPLAEFGYNRDGKKGKMQIVIGLLTDDSGYPLSVQVFPGSESDQTTLAGQMHKLREQFGAERLVFVGDRGTITSARVEEFESGLFGLGIDFLTALRRKDMMDLVEDEEHPLQLSLFDHQDLAEVTEGGSRYVLCYNANRAPEDSRTRERLLDLTEEKLASIERMVKSGRLKRLEKIHRRLYRWLNRWGMERFFEVETREGHLSYRRNEREIERYRRLDGCYVLRTSVPAESMDKYEVQRRYKSLSLIEQSFRNLKSADLEVRPVRVRLEDRVRGHVFLCSLALRVTIETRARLRKLLERDAVNRSCEGGSLKEIWKELKDLTIGFVSIAGSIECQVGEPSEGQSEILSLLGMPTTKVRLSVLIEKSRE